MVYDFEYNLNMRIYKLSSKVAYASPRTGTRYASPERGHVYASP